jgi:hypothetical protein
VIRAWQLQPDPKEMTSFVPLKAIAISALSRLMQVAFAR